MKSRLPLLLAIAGLAGAHPMGNFSVSHYTHVDVSAKGVEVTYVLDLAEVPTYSLLRDWKLDAKSPQAELDQKASEQAKQWAEGLEFRAGGKPVEPHLMGAVIRVADGAGGLSVARITSTFELPGAKSPLSYEDRNFPERAGWKEIVIGSGAGVEMVSASQGGMDRSKALTEYPADPTLAPPQDLRASLEWRVTGVIVSQAAPPRVIPIPQPKPVAAPATPPPTSTPKVAQPRGTVVKGDFLSRLLAKDKIGWQWLLLGVLVAFGIGGAHALEPGHGKTIVAAYLVGSRGTVKHAAILGGVVTFTHTISVFLLGLATLLLSKTVVPEHVIRVMEAISGMSIVAIGAVMLVQRLRNLHSGGHAHGHSHSHGDGHIHAHAMGQGHSHDSHDHAESHDLHVDAPVGTHALHGHADVHGGSLNSVQVAVAARAHSHAPVHDHGHSQAHEHSHGAGHSHSHCDTHGHDHGHGHAHDHSHDAGHSHSHGDAHSHDHGHSQALDHSHGAGHSHSHGDAHSHDHDHGRSHDHSHDAGHSHSHGDAHSHDHGHSQGHDHSHVAGHSHGHDHDHGHSHGHSHVPEGEITFASLIGLGVSGGLVPCPAALVIMLAAIAFGHPGAGLLLLISFSLGLAGVLMAVGMVVLYAKSWLPDPGASSQHPLFRLVPVLSAIVILCLGLLMTGVSLGWVRPGLLV